MYFAWLSRYSFDSWSLRLVQYCRRGPILRSTQGQVYRARIYPSNPHSTPSNSCPVPLCSTHRCEHVHANGAAYVPEMHDIDPRTGIQDVVHSLFPTQNPCPAQSI